MFEGFIRNVLGEQVIVERRHNPNGSPTQGQVFRHGAFTVFVAISAFLVHCLGVFIKISDKTLGRGLAGGLECPLPKAKIDLVNAGRGRETFNSLRTLESWHQEDYHLRLGYPQDT